MKQKLQSLLRNRRGISIAETAVAIAIIMLVSAAAASLLSAATQVEEDAVHTTEINEYAESALDCFRWATIETYFDQAIRQLGFDSMEPPAADETDGESAEETSGVWYVLERSDYRIIVRVNYNTAPSEFEISAVDEKGKEIYGFTYEK